MGRILGLIACTLIVLASLLPGTSAFASGRAAGPSGARGLLPHAPILIEGNAGFTAANGVTSGTGTAADPFLIDGWEIDARADHGIYVRNTTAHFVISNVSISNVTGTPNSMPAIGCEHVGNGTIRDSACSISNFGLYVNGSSNMTISGNAIFNNGQGLAINGSSNFSVIGNDIHDNTVSGISLQWCENIGIRDNDVGTSTYYGIWAFKSAVVTVSNNSVHDNRIGMEITDVLNWSISGNHIFNNSMGGIREGWGGYDVSLYGTSPFHTEPDTIINNTIYNNSYNGLYICGNYTGGIDIAGNEVYDNTPAGIRLDWGAYEITLRQNNVSGNRGNGIELAGVRNDTVSGNRACRNNGSGIYVDRSPIYDQWYYTPSMNNTLTGNEASNNTGCGILVGNSTGDRLRDNLARDNSAGGIAVLDSLNETLEGNVACNDSACGIFVGSSLEILPPHSGFHRLISNRVDGNDRGIILSWSNADKLTGNSAAENRLDGIWLDNATVATLVGNRLDGNLRSGVRASNSYGMELRDSNLTDNGLFLEGWDVLFFATHTVANNTVNGKPLHYYVGQGGFTVPTDAGQVVLVNCANASIGGVNITRATAPVECYGSVNVTVNASRLGDSTYGIYVIDSNLTVSNSTMAHEVDGSDYVIDGNSTLVSLNTTFNGSRVNITAPEGRLSVLWHLGLFVRDDATGAPIGNSTVGIERVAGGTVASGLTDGSGRYPPVLVHAYDRTSAGFEQFNPYVVSASARYYRDARSSPPIEVNSTFTYDFDMADISSPWSRLGPVPEYINSTSLLLDFTAGDNGSGLSHILLYYEHAGDRLLYAPAGAGPQFNSSPVVFANFSTDGGYRFSSVAYDLAGGMEPGPYGTVGTVLDTLAPDFTVYPWDGAGEFSPVTKVLVNFTEPMNASSVRAVIEPGNWTEAWSDDHLSLEMAPSASLEYDTMYALSVGDGMDLAGNHLAPGRSSFNTTFAPDSTVPRVEGVRPPSGSILGPGETNITLTFNERMNWTLVAAGLLANGAPAPAGTGSGRNYTFVLVIAAGARYELSLLTVAADRAGNRLDSPFTWNYAGAPLTGSIRGKVVDDLGEGLPGANVSVAGLSTVTDAQGAFSFPAVRPGEHELTAGGLAGLAENTTRISLDSGENLTFLIVLHRLETGLRGMVVDEEGRPLAGAHVDVFRAGKRVAGFVTDPSGKFSFELPPGRYGIEVTKAGFRTARLTDQVVSPGTVSEVGMVRLSLSLDQDYLLPTLVFILVVMMLVAILLFRKRKRQLAQ
jgi:parallel beta-helix repeat protein